MSTELPRILILGTADWDQAIATNQHYVARELAKGAVDEVIFVESLGLRRPQLKARDVRRILRRIVRLFRIPLWTGGGGASTRPVPPSVRIVSPIIIPVHSGLVATLNSTLLRRQIRGWLEWNGPRVLWAYTPVTYGLEKSSTSAFYHCVDLLGEFPGVPRIVIEQAERHLASTGVPAAATSATVRSHLHEMGFSSVRVWENVADTAVIEASHTTETPRSMGRVIFSGNLSSKKIDFTLLRGLLRIGLDVVLAGPCAEGGGDDHRLLEQLIDEGADYLGVITLQELAVQMSSAVVGVIPYHINDYTRGVSPLKIYEYLSAGLAVVSTPLPSVAPREPHVFVEDTASGFIDRVLWLSHVPARVDVLARVRLARAHSWDVRGDEVREAAGVGLGLRRTK